MATNFFVHEDLIAFWFNPRLSSVPTRAKDIATIFFTATSWSYYLFLLKST